MTSRPHVLSLIAFTAFIFCLFSPRVDARGGFRWEAVSYKGNNYVTLRSLKQFFNFQEKHEGKKIILEDRHFKITIKVGSKECYMNRVLFILSHAPTIHKGQVLISRTDLNTLIDPVIRPAFIKRARNFKTVVIDPGHGGKDPGSRGYYSDEKYYTLKVARLLRDMLQRKGYNVVMTRDSDVFISLANRVRIANRYPNAIFICIHFNSGQSKAHGIETFTISPVGVPHLGRSYRPGDSKAVPGNIMGSASIALATAVHSRTLMYLHKYNMADRGIKHARFNVLTGIKIPAILLEGGFLSNRTEATKIHSLTYQKALASGIVRAIDIYRSAIVNKKKTHATSARPYRTYRPHQPSSIKPTSAR